MFLTEVPLSAEHLLDQLCWADKYQLNNLLRVSLFRIDGWFVFYTYEYTNHPLNKISATNHSVMKSSKCQDFWVALVNPSRNSYWIVSAADGDQATRVFQIGYCKLF